MLPVFAGASNRQNDHAAWRRPFQRRSRADLEQSSALGLGPAACRARLRYVCTTFWGRPEFLGPSCRDRKIAPTRVSCPRRIVVICGHASPAATAQLGRSAPANDPRTLAARRGIGRTRPRCGCGRRCIHSALGRGLADFEGPLSTRGLRRASDITFRQTDLFARLPQRKPGTIVGSGLIDRQPSSSS
jgi:hypothetical protein